MKTAQNLFFNFSLLLILLGLLVFPSLVGQSLLGKPSERGLVAGIETVSLNRVSILPNLFDFNGYARFIHLVKNTTSYQDKLVLTVFAGQIASYRNLYSIYNTNNSSILLKVELLPLGDRSFGESQLQINSGQESLSGNPLLIKIGSNQKAVVGITVAPKSKGGEDLPASLLFNLTLSL